MVLSMRPEITERYYNDSCKKNGKLSFTLRYYRGAWRQYAKWQF
jgi:hypothetical protein